MSDLMRKKKCRHGLIDPELDVHREHPEWAACMGYGLVPVEPDYYEVETDGTSLSGPRFRVVTARPVGPVYGYSREPLERYAVYRVRLTDGEADNE